MTSAFGTMTREVRACLDDALAVWLRPRVAEATKVSAEVGAAAEAIERLSTRGGKRVRAALVGAAYVACGGPSWSDVVPAMIAIELLQTYLLIHDDWMDDDAVRRGGPSVHVALRERLGDRSMGDACAILAGDLASAFAQSALLETKVAPERLLSAARTFARIQEEVVVGQLSEMRAVSSELTSWRSLPTVEDIHARKTASYTVTGPLALGAVLAGADDARAQAFSRFGRPLGVAFQLRDDLLGVFGDPSATGKPIWSDVRQGKRTALVAEMRGHDGLARVLGKRDATHAELEAVVKAMESTGARSRVEGRVAELLAEARAALEAMDLPNAEGKAILRGAVGALGERSS